jgi:MFS family permease
MVAEILDGARVLKADRALIALIVIGMASSFVFGFEQVIHVLVADEQLGIGASGVGVLAAAVGLGGVLIAPFTPRLGASRSIAVILVVAAAMQGVPTILLSVIHAPAVATAVLFVEGAAVIVQEVLYITLLQRAVLGDKLGRILGLQDSLGASGQMLGSIAVPVLVALVDLDWTLVIGGAAVVTACLAAAPGVRRLAQRTEAERQRLAPLVDELRATGILGEATQAALERIARSSEVVQVAPGSAVVAEGEIADRLYVIRRGAFAVEREGAGVLAELGPSAWFGEVGIVHKRPRNATVRSVDGGEVIAVPGSVFLGAVEQAEVLPDPLHRTLLARSLTAIDATDGA